MRLWSTETGRELRRMKGSGNGVHGVAFSNDGRRSLMCDADGRLRLWDLTTGDELYRFEGQTGPVNSAAFSPDDCQALSGNSDNTLRLWKLPRPDGQDKPATKLRGRQP